jgi:PST family polysaccharide transporter
VLQAFARLNERCRDLWARPTLRRVVANSGWLVAERAVRMAAGLVVTVWVARHLGPSDYGVLSSTVAFVALFGAIAGLGVDVIAVREISRRPADAPTILGTALGLRVAAGVAGAALAWGLGLALGLGKSGPPVVLALLSCTLMFQSADVVDYWFQANLRSQLTVAAKLTAFAAAAALRVAFVLHDQPVEMFALATLAESALAAAALGFAYARNQGPGRWRFDPRTAKNLLSDSWPLMISAAAVMLYLRIDQVLLRALVGPGEAGALAAVLPFTECWYVLATSLSVSLAPVMMRIHAASVERFYQRLQQIFRAAVVGGVAIAAGMSLAAGALVSLLLGPAFQASAPVLAVQVWCVVFVFLGMAENLWMIAENRTRIRLVKTLIGASSSVALNLWLAPRFGALGAAASAVAAQFITVYLCNFLLARRIFVMQTRAFLFR